MRLLLVVAAAACLMPPAMAAEAPAATAPKHAPAGSVIPNTAEVSYVVSGQSYNGSASVSIVVDQLLDVSAAWQDAAPVKAPAGSSDKSLLFKLTNEGNGSDSYALKPEVRPDPKNGFTATHCLLFLDSDNDEHWSKQDAPYPASAPTVAAGASLDILALCNIPEDAVDESLSHVTVQVSSNTLTGRPGTSKPDPDRTGVTLVVGLTGNTATATGTYIAANVTYTISSTQLVTDRSGGHVATSGSRITYTILVTPKGTAIGQNLVLSTPIPKHTTYVPGTMVLDGKPVSDSAGDDDGGYFDSSTNTTFILLGDVSGSAAPRQFVFQVTIN